MIEFVGLTDEVHELRMGLLSEGLGALERTSDKLVHTFSITGTPGEARARVSEWEGVVDNLVLHTPYVPPFTAEESEDCYHNIIDTFRHPV
jgi:hypothetical protein